LHVDKFIRAFSMTSVVVVAALDGLSVSILDVDVLLLYGGLVHHLL